MAYLASVDASMVIATSFEFVDGQSLLGPVPGVVILVGTTLFPFHIFLKEVDFEGPFECALTSLDCPRGPLLLEATLLSLPPKLP